MNTLMLFSALALSVSSFAQAANETSQAQSASTAAVPDQGFRVYGSLGVGGGTFLGDQSALSGGGESVLAGINIGPRTEHWELDGGLGWQYLHRSRVRIRSGRADLSPRYRLGKGWQLGPIATLNFGTDTGLDTIARSNSIASVYGGAKTTYDLPNLGRLPVQAWAEILTAVTSSRRDDFSMLVGLRIGLSLTSTTYAEHKTSTVVTSTTRIRRDVHIALDPEKIYFGTSSSQLRPTVTEALRDAGALLASDQEAWASVVVDGHADHRGSKELNDRLSRERAMSVRDLLVQNGMLSDKIQIEAFGYSRPADPASGPQAWARNRRVEMTFKNVKDPQALLKTLSPLMTSTTEIF